MPRSKQHIINCKTPSTLRAYTIRQERKTTNACCYATLHPSSSINHIFRVLESHPIHPHRLNAAKPALKPVRETQTKAAGHNEVPPFLSGHVRDHQTITSFPQTTPTNQEFTPTMTPHPCQGQALGASTTPKNPRGPRRSRHAIAAAASAAGRGPRTRGSRSRRRGPAGSRRPCRCCRSSAGGTCPCGCSAARAVSLGGPSGGRCPIFFLTRC